MTIFTIGYEGLTADSFIKYLKQFKISCIADVRHLPLSRKKGFSKTAMTALLEAENIRYDSYRDLGTSKAMREALYQNYDYQSFFKAYAKSLAGKEKTIDKILYDVNHGENVALLCFEKDATKCHRSLLAHVIKKRDGNGLEIKHIKPVV